jgi:hypothetical protein
VAEPSRNVIIVPERRPAVDVQTLTVRPDARGVASLDGRWEFFPGDHDQAGLDELTPEAITVPGLWEAQGHLDLDGPAWYRRRFFLTNTDGDWTLRFDAVMDVADVYLNGRYLGRHEHPFTPFEFVVTDGLVTGVNVLDVRVVDPPVTDPDHIRMAHGKQGWANHVFPSRPSLYMTYGGIWQSVSLRRHDALVIRDVFVNGDPDDLVVAVELTNLRDVPVAGELAVRLLGKVAEQHPVLEPGETRTINFYFGVSVAPRWSPEQPNLHRAVVDVLMADVVSDRKVVRFGLRRVRIVGDRIHLNDVPYRMKSVLVQGFDPEHLYAEGDTEAIRREVRAARDMGFNTLRLHIKAFDPRYLDVCDEEGMLLHCDLPVAEPIAHAELGDGTLVSVRSVEAIREQVRRDRNHPSVILWSAMNELGLDGPGSRETTAYAQFARTLYAAVRDCDPTRPVIENDWVEPDPDRVFSSPILTAHWYGRLHADYLDKLERESRRWAGTGRPLYITEFGDWGLPMMPEQEQPPFWDPREVYQVGLAASRWPEPMGRFVRETHRYQGISDRLQLEIFRRHDHIGGYCVTELTDVPHEFNGLLDLHREPKPIAAAEVARGNQTVLPMLHVDRLVAVAGEPVAAAVHVANDGPELDGVEIEVRFSTAVAPSSAGADVAPDCGQAHTVPVGRLAGYRAQRVGEVAVTAPGVPGNHDLLVGLRAADGLTVQNRYPIHVVLPPSAPYPVRVIGDGPTIEALRGVAARPDGEGTLIVAEGALDAAAGEEAARRLAGGETVVILAQEPEAAAHYPMPTRILRIETEWGSSTYHFTVGSGAITSLPRRNLLVGEEATVQAVNVIVGVDGEVFPTEPVVIAYKPVPGAVSGTVVGAHEVGEGRLILCQYRLVQPATRGDAAARALLADIVRWAADPRTPTRSDNMSLDDGRTVTYYHYDKAART